MYLCHVDPLSIPQHHRQIHSAAENPPPPLCFEVIWPSRSMPVVESGNSMWTLFTALGSEFSIMATCQWKPCHYYCATPSICLSCTCCGCEGAWGIVLSMQSVSGHVEWVAFLGVIVVIELGCESGGEDVCANGVVGIVAIINNRDCMWEFQSC